MFCSRVQVPPPSSDRNSPDPTPPYTRAPLLRWWSHSVAKTRPWFVGSMARSMPPVVVFGVGSTSFQFLPMPSSR